MFIGKKRSARRGKAWLAHRRMPMLERLEEKTLLATWSGDIPNGTVWTNNEVQIITGDARVPAGATLTV